MTVTAVVMPDASPNISELLRLVEISGNNLSITLFNVEDYETTQTVKNISKSVINESGKTASDTVRDTNPFTAEDTEADTQTQ